jgi:hypothetical protein
MGQDHDRFQREGLSWLTIGATLGGIGAAAGFVWGLLLRSTTPTEQRSPILFAAAGAFVLLFIPSMIVLMGFAEQGNRYLTSLKPPKRRLAKPSPNESPGPLPVIRTTETALGEHWTMGCPIGDRMGPKTFEAQLSMELSPLDVLIQVSRLLTQLQSVQPWRVNGQVRSHEDDTGVSVTASAQYRWDNAPYFVEKDGKQELIQSIAGPSKSGTGEIHLKSGIIGDDSNDRVIVRMEFSEPTYPMWLKRHAEGMVALTLVELGRELSSVLSTDVSWQFVTGDWTVFQMLGAPSGSLTVQRMRGR